MMTYLQIVSTSGRRWLDRSRFRPGDFALFPTRSSRSVRPRAAGHVRGALGRWREPQQEPQAGRLAGAVRPDEADRAFGDRHAEIVDRADVAEDLRQTDGLNEGHHRLLIAAVRCPAAASDTRP